MFVYREAVILHADADAFFASVEQRDNPNLRGRPTIVGPGVVTAASYEARAYGVHGGMSGRRARRLCPDAAFVTPRFSAYTEASKALFGIFKQTSPRVEGLSMEEAFLDVRGLEAISGSPREIAVRLRRRVRDEVGLPVSVGVARTKVLAKMASRAAKPDGLLLIAPADEEAFLHPLGGGEPLGRRPGDGGEAPRTRDPHRRRARPAQRGRARLVPRSRRRPAPPFDRPSSRSAAGPLRSRAGARSARSRRSGARRSPEATSMPGSSPSSTGSPGGCAPRAAPAGP